MAWMGAEVVLVFWLWLIGTWCIYVCKNEHNLFERGVLGISNDVDWCGVAMRRTKFLGKFFGRKMCSVLCIRDI